VGGSGVGVGYRWRCGYGVGVGSSRELERGYGGNLGRVGPPCWAGMWIDSGRAVVELLVRRAAFPRWVKLGCEGQVQGSNGENCPIIDDLGLKLAYFIFKTAKKIFIFGRKNIFSTKKIIFLGKKIFKVGKKNIFSARKNFKVGNKNIFLTGKIYFSARKILNRPEKIFFRPEMFFFRARKVFRPRGR
jgi:hypothetical protein